MADQRYAEEKLAKARQALADAERLIDAGGTDGGVVNRLYYASFHAAQAALYVRGVDSGSHGAARSRFGEELVLEGEATREQGRLLTTLADLRQQADYGYGPIDLTSIPSPSGPKRSSKRWRRSSVRSVKKGTRNSSSRSDSRRTLLDP